MPTETIRSKRPATSRQSTSSKRTCPSRPSAAARRPLPVPRVPGGRDAQRPPQGDADRILLFPADVPADEVEQRAYVALLDRQPPGHVRLAEAERRVAADRPLGAAVGEADG